MVVLSSQLNGSMIVLSSACLFPNARVPWGAWAFARRGAR